MLDTGGHMAQIRGLAWTPDGTQIVSASNDKIIRVWDSATGHTIRTIRGAIGPGDAGLISAMALSPDGRWLVVGGMMAAFDGANQVNVGTIRLYDFATGDLLILLKGHTGSVMGLAFAPDGLRLISGAGDNRAILWEAGGNAAGGWRAARQLYTLSGHKDEIYAVGFSPDGMRAVTGSFDATLRLWDVATGQQIGADMTGHTDMVYALAVHPTRGHIFSGSMNGDIRVWDGVTGKAIGRLANQGTAVGALAFAPSGERLVSGTAGPANTHVFVWDGKWSTITEARPARIYSGHDNVVAAAAISPDGRWAATAGGNEFPIHIWDIATGERRRGRDGQPLTLAGAGAASFAAGVSDDGRWIAWGNTSSYQSHHSRGPLEHRLRLPLAPEGLGRPERMVGAPSESRFLRARVEHGPWSLVHRGRAGHTFGDDALDLRQDGKATARIIRGSTDGYQHRAYSFTTDGKAIISGGNNGLLIAYDNAGQGLANFIGHEGDIWAVTPSADARLLITASADQTIRLWPLAPLSDADIVPTRPEDDLPSKQIRPIVTLFHGRDGEWVMWTPGGYYTGSEHAGDLVTWQQNLGPDKAARVVKAEQLRHTLRRTDIVERAIILGDSAAAARELAGKGPTLADLVARPPPAIDIQGDVTSTTGYGIVVLDVERTGRAVTGFDFYLAGATADARRKVTARSVPVPATFKSRYRDRDAQAFEVPLAAGTNIVDVVGRTDAGESRKVDRQIINSGPSRLASRGRLRVLAVGVDRYPTAGTIYGDLNFAGSDACAFVDIARQRMAGLYDAIDVEVLGDKPCAGTTVAPPTRAKVAAALQRLSASQPEDTVALFFAGHGDRWAGQYRFLPGDFRRVGTQGEGENAYSWPEMRDALNQIQGRRVVFFDTCRSGDVSIEGLANDAKGRFTAFSASSSRGVAEERQDRGHGNFTYALREAFLGFRAISHDNTTIRTLSLGDFLDYRVNELSGGRQQVDVHQSGNFVLGQR
jgi:WD40 repeat protein